MFEIQFGEQGQVVVSGRLDAANAEKALAFLNGIESHCEIEMSGLEYISSAGLGVLLRTHKRLSQEGNGLHLINVNAHIRDIFSYSGFDKLFDIKAPGSGE